MRQRKQIKQFSIRALRDPGLSHLLLNLNKGVNQHLRNKLRPIESNDFYIFGWADTYDWIKNVKKA